MLLLVKGRPPRSICRECRRLHAAKDCPKRKGSKKTPQTYEDRIREAAIAEWRQRRQQA